GLLRRVAPRQLDGLGDDRGRGNVGPLEELVDADPQEVAIDDRHAFEGPVLGEAPDDAVDLVLMLADAGHEVGGGVRGGVRLSRMGQTRVRYSPVRVSTLIRSPGLTNSGTCTVMPVSNVAGLRAPATRSPWIPGSVSVIDSSTAAGRSTPTISFLYICSTAESPSFRYLVASPRASSSTSCWSYVVLSMNTYC